MDSVHGLPPSQGAEGISGQPKVGRGHRRTQARVEGELPSSAQVHAAVQSGRVKPVTPATPKSRVADLTGPDLASVNARRMASAATTSRTAQVAQSYKWGSGIAGSLSDQEKRELERSTLSTTDRLLFGSRFRTGDAARQVSKHLEDFNKYLRG